MITKKELMLRIIDLELQNVELEERIYMVELTNKPKTKKPAKKGKK